MDRSAEHTALRAVYAELGIIARSTSELPEREGILHRRSMVSTTFTPMA